MSKKMMLLALSVVSAALFAMPAGAAANSAHIDLATSFTITAKGATSLEDKEGSKVTCHEGVTGSGKFDTTTTGTIKLTFHLCTAFGGLVSCTSHNQSSARTITTTELPFHLIDLGTHAGVLITPNGNHFATFTCAGSNKVVSGNGVIGTITSPTCGVSASTATLSFAASATGIQQHTTFTGKEYHLLSNGVKAAQEGEGQIHFAAPRTIDCTT